jgi:hypothetical protein
LAAVAWRSLDATLQLDALWLDLRDQDLDLIHLVIEERATASPERSDWRILRGRLAAAWVARYRPRVAEVLAQTPDATQLADLDRVDQNIAATQRRLGRAVGAEMSLVTLGALRDRLARHKVPLLMHALVAPAPAEAPVPALRHVRALDEAESLARRMRMLDEEHGPTWHARRAEAHRLFAVRYVQCTVDYYTHGLSTPGAGPYPAAPDPMDSFSMARLQAKSCSRGLERKTIIGAYDALISALRSLYDQMANDDAVWSLTRLIERYQRVRADLQPRRWHRAGEPCLPEWFNVKSYKL